MDDYLVTQEVAALVRKQPQTLRKLRTHGGGPPYYKVGSRVLYKRSEIIAWVERDRVVPGGDAQPETGGQT